MATGEIVKPREIVKANNELFRCRYNLKDIVAGRIFVAFASLVNTNDVKENDNFVEYNIPASSILSENSDGGDNYDQLLDAARILVGHKIEQHKHGKHFAVYTLFSKIEYENGTITGQLHKDLIPFFITAREKFTKLQLDEYMKLPSIYSQALFCFLKSWNDKNEVITTVIELHKMLATPESFVKNFAEFKRRVLDKAHKDINKLTTLKYDYEAVKVGRSYKEIKFVFKKEISIRCTNHAPCKAHNKHDTPKTTETNNSYPVFSAFFKKIAPNGDTLLLIEAHKLWININQSGKAPLASDVPFDNTLSVIEFLKQWDNTKK